VFPPRALCSAILFVPDAPTPISLSSVWNDEEDSDEGILSPLRLVVISCSSLLFFVVLFLLQVASISKSNGAKSHAGVLPRIQEASYYRAVNQDKRLNQIENS